MPYIFLLTPSQGWTFSLGLERYSLGNRMSKSLLLIRVFGARDRIFSRILIQHGLNITISIFNDIQILNRQKKKREMIYLNMMT